MNWRPWNKELELEQKKDTQDKEDIDRRLTYLEAQVRILQKRAILKERIRESG